MFVECMHIHMMILCFFVVVVVVMIWQHLRDDLARIDESWAAARFDSLPHVVRLLTAKDELQALKEQSEVIEDVVDEVVHAYHSGFNRAIQNYSQVPFYLFRLGNRRK